MKTRRNVLLALTVFLLLACSCPLVARTAPATQTSPATETIPPSDIVPSNTPLPSLPTSSPTSASSPTPTISPTPSTPQATPISVNVNCRSGPDVHYPSISVLMFGDSSQITGRNDDSSWWYIHDPTNPGGYCWVAASVVTTSGNLGGLPAIAFAGIVTDVSVDASLPSSIFCGGPNPVEFSGTITTNGSAKVKFQWEITGDKSNTTSPETLNFSDAGTKDAPYPGAYSVDCGTYNITLHILSPNDVSAMQKFKIQP